MRFERRNNGSPDQRSGSKRTAAVRRAGSLPLLRILLLLLCLLTACDNKTVKTEVPAADIVSPTPEPKFDRDAAVFGDDADMKDLSDFTEEFRTAGVSIIDGTPSLSHASMDTLKSVLGGKNVRLLKLDGLMIGNIEKIGLGRFGIEPQSAVLSEKTAGILAAMENCRALAFFDLNEEPIPENIVWPHVRSLRVYSSWLERQDQPLSERFPALRELIVIQNSVRKPDLNSLGLPETLESIEFGKTTLKSDLAESAALLAALDAKDIPSIQFINGKAAGSFDPNITDQQMTDYERNIFLADIIDEMNAKLEENKGRTVKVKTPGIRDMQLPENVHILMISENDLSAVSYKGDNDKISAAITEDPKECGVLFILRSVSGAESGMVIAGSGGRAPTITSHYLYAVDMANGDIYCDVMWFDPNLGAISEEQKKNNELFREKGPWGFIEPLF